MKLAVNTNRIIAALIRDSASRNILLSDKFVVSDIVIQAKMDEAKEIMDKIDPDDTPFIALALAVENDGVWSDDRHFEQQGKIKVWKTEDLVKLL